VLRFSIAGRIAPNNRIPALVDTAPDGGGQPIALLLGPMAGQNHHFMQYAPERLPYAIDRYVKETNRLYGVLNKRLADREYITGGYSIADMACYPWVVPHERQGQNLADFPRLRRWFEAVKSRPATIAAYEKGKALNTAPSVSEESRKILFGQTAAVVR
jgi:GST-like protein